MKYMLMIYEDDEARVANMDEWLPTCSAYVAAMQKAGIYVSGGRLRSAGTATTLRIRESGTQLLDGPYADTKEQIGGFHIIDVPDLDVALAWAARCPSASRGSIEIRPLWV